MCIQAAPAIILAVFIYSFPESPRWLINVGQEDKALEVLAWLRETEQENVGLQIEFLEMKAQKYLSKHLKPKLIHIYKMEQKCQNSKSI